jgi:hypothetical protein
MLSLAFFTIQTVNDSRAIQLRTHQWSTETTMSLLATPASSIERERALALIEEQALLQREFEAYWETCPVGAEATPASTSEWQRLTELRSDINARVSAHITRASRRHDDGEDRGPGSGSTVYSACICMSGRDNRWTKTQTTYCPATESCTSFAMAMAW